MLNEIMHIDDENEARRILLKLGNGIGQAEAFLEEWKKSKKPAPAPVVVQKVVTEKEVEKQTEVPKQVKVGSTVKK